MQSLIPESLARQLRMLNAIAELLRAYAEQRRPIPALLAECMYRHLADVGQALGRALSPEAPRRRRAQ